MTLPEARTVREQMARALCISRGLNPDEQVETGFETPWPRWTFFLPDVSALVEALDAAGFVIAPKEATIEQVQAMREARNTEISMSAIYRAGIAARPRIEP